MHHYGNKPLRMAGSGPRSVLILEVKQKKRKTDPYSRKTEAKANKIK